MNITVVGLGLIGASLAKAIKKYTNNTVYGIDINEDVLQEALQDGTIDKIADVIDLAETDLTIISLYVQSSINFVVHNIKNFKKGSVVIDTCGVKRVICDNLVDLAHKNGFEFIGAHPMAGKEKNGYKYSEAELFENAYMILTPIKANEKNMKMLVDLSKQIHFRAVTISTPSEHDRIIAYTSQIPHVLACAYISDPDAIRHDGFSAGSYKDISRVADINARLWQELFSVNSDYLTSHIDMLIDNLTSLKTMIENHDGAALTENLENAKSLKNKIG